MQAIKSIDWRTLLLDLVRYYLLALLTLSLVDAAGLQHWPLLIGAVFGAVLAMFGKAIGLRRT